MRTPLGNIRLSVLLPLVFTLFALLLSVAGIIYFFSGTDDSDMLLQEVEIETQKTKPQKKEEMEVQSLPEDNEKDISLSNTDADKFTTAKIADDYTLCEKITDEKMRNACWNEIVFQQAIKEGNREKCALLRDKNKKTRCIDQIIFNLAKERKIFTECSNIVSTTLKNRCLQMDSREKIMAAKSIEDCANIRTADERKNCRNFFVAKIIQSEEKPNAKICAYLPEEESKTQCFLQIAIKQAKKTRSIAPCKTLANTASKTSCLQSLKKLLQDEEMVQYINAGNVEACQKYTDNERRAQCQNGALIVRAKKEKNPVYCNAITAAHQQKICMEKASQARDAALYKRAKKEKNPTLCKNIIDSNIKDACLVYVQKK